MTPKTIATVGVAAPTLALLSLSAAAAGAFLTLCPFLFVMFLMALLENAAARQPRRAPQWRPPSLSLGRACLAFLMAVLTTSSALIAWRAAQLLVEHG